jgi:diguanylate cyclase (GGDEF)-like protein
MRSQVLLVDDEPASLLYYEYILKEHFSVETAAGGKEALRMLERGGPSQVVISDLYMPDISGIDLLEQVREKHPDTVRILFTGGARAEELANEIDENLVFGFLEKTLKPLNLVQFVRAAIEHHQVLKARKRAAKIKSVLTSDELSFFKESDSGEAAEAVEEKSVLASRAQFFPEQGPAETLEFPAPYSGRKALMHNMARMIAQAKRTGAQVALLYLRLDFKGPGAENSRSHEDAVSSISRIIGARLRDSDYLARIGDTEFAVMLWDISSAEAIGKVTKDITDTLKSNKEIRSGTSRIDAGFGSSVFPMDGLNPETLLEKAMNQQNSSKAVAC